METTDYNTLHMEISKLINDYTTKLTNDIENLLKSKLEKVKTEDELPAKIKKNCAFTLKNGNQCSFQPTKGSTFCGKHSSKEIKCQVINKNEKVETSNSMSEVSSKVTTKKSANKEEVTKRTIKPRKREPVKERVEEPEIPIVQEPTYVNSFFPEYIDDSESVIPDQELQSDYESEKESYDNYVLSE